MIQEESKSLGDYQEECIKLDNLLMKLGQQIRRGEIEAIYKPETIMKQPEEDKHISELPCLT